MAGEAAKGQRLKFRRFRARNRLFPLLLSSINLSESCRSSQAPRTSLQRRVRSRLSPPGASPLRTRFRPATEQVGRAIARSHRRTMWRKCTHVDVLATIGQPAGRGEHTKASDTVHRNTLYSISRTGQRRCANYIVKSSRCARPREPATGFAVGTSRPFRMRLCQGIRIGRFLAHFTQFTVT